MWLLMSGPTGLMLALATAAIACRRPLITTCHILLSARRRRRSRVRAVHQCATFLVPWPPRLATLEPPQPGDVALAMMPCKPSALLSSPDPPAPAAAGMLRVLVLPTDPEECENVLRQLEPDLRHAKLLGLDCEWQPEVGPGSVPPQRKPEAWRPEVGSGPGGGQPGVRPHHPVSVLQISTASLCCVLRPAALGLPLPPTLVGLLQDALLLKAGVSVFEDVARLRMDFGVVVQGALDIRSVLATTRPHHMARHGTSLQALSASLLGLAVDKSMQCSDWGNDRLTEAQISYAALDAWLSRQLALAALHPHADPLPSTCSPPSCSSPPIAAKAPVGLIVQLEPDGGSRRGALSVPWAEHVQLAVSEAAAWCGPDTGPPPGEGVALWGPAVVPDVAYGDGEPCGRAPSSPGMLTKPTVVPDAACGGGAPCERVSSPLGVLTGPAVVQDAACGAYATGPPSGLRESCEGCPSAHGARAVENMLSGKGLSSAQSARGAQDMLVHSVESGSGSRPGLEPVTQTVTRQHDRVDRAVVDEAILGGGRSGGRTMDVAVASSGSLDEAAALLQLAGFVGRKWGKQQQLRAVAGAQGTASCMGEVGVGGASRHPAGGAAPDGVRHGAGKPRKDTSARLPTRKRALYENCRLLAPDGQALCTCGRKRVMWYLNRDLATVVEGDASSPSGPLTVQLHFDPAGRGHADDQYYLADKENCCCCCGHGERTGQPYLRHNVVPHCYRRHFPLAFKSHLSHDIVLMCPACHQVCNMYDHARMTQLGEQHGAPLKEDALKYKRDMQRQAVRNAGRALLADRSGGIPSSRRRELEAVLLQHYGGDGVDEALVHDAANVETRVVEGSWESHAERVVRGMSHDQLRDFVVDWRRHFVESMRPRHLPPHWSVDSRVQNSSMRARGAEGAA